MRAVRSDSEDGNSGGRSTTAQTWWAMHAGGRQPSVRRRRVAKNGRRQSHDRHGGIASNGAGQNCRFTARMVMTARMSGVMDGWAFGRSGRLVADRGRGRLIAIHLADHPEGGSRREQESEDERVTAELHNSPSIPVPYSSTRRSLRAFPITDTELNVMAALAIIGLSSSPNHGYRIPAATGTPATL